jgi:gliding motility-associated-like protein
MKPIFTALIFSILFVPFSVLQSQEAFFLNGSATTTNDSCFQLTPAVNWQAGSIWNEKMIDLSESFEVVTEVFLGCTDLEGADGIVFGLQPISTSIGMGGGDLGFGNVEPSLGIEFDAFQNLDFGDPDFDHITVIRDGILNHNLPNGSLAGPVQTSATSPNVEDCQFHTMQVRWEADIQTLTVYFDCELRISYTADIVNEIFNGDPLVFWGFTSATGGLSNVQEVCFTYTSVLDGLEDQVICSGEEVQLEVSGGVSYNWTPALGLSDTGIANPIASPEVTTLYSVEITNDCGISFVDEVLIIVEDELFEMQIDPSSIDDPVLPGFDLDFTANILSGNVDDYSFMWSSSIGSTFSHPDSISTVVTTSETQTGEETITVVVTSQSGCTAEASVTFEIANDQYALPNVFTPNGDNVNDTFGVVTQGIITDYSCRIFNRWGALVFESNSADQTWDGTYNSEAAPSDVYIYSIQFTIGDMQVDEKGDLTLLR